MKQNDNNNTVQVTAQVQILGTKTKKRLTQCENFSFQATLRHDSSPAGQQLDLETQTYSRFKEEFMKRMKNVPAVKHAIGSTQWEVQVLAVQYN